MKNIIQNDENIQNQNQQIEKRTSKQIKINQTKEYIYI